VQELGSRLLHGAHDFGMRVASRADSNACSEIEEAIAVDIPDLGAPAMGHDERIVARI
jgi:hypothetical protein